MEKHDEELIHSLLANEPELQSLYTEHVTLEKQLNVLQQKQHLSNAEVVEKRRLQKLKLAGKDQIMGILAKHRAN